MEMYRIGANGMEKIIEHGPRPLYSRVFAFGGGMAASIWAVIDNQNNLVKLPPHYEGDYFQNPFRRLEKHDGPISKKFGIGFYWDDENPDFRFSEDVILDAIISANEFVKEQQQRADAKAKADVEEREGFLKHYKHLTQNPTGDVKITKSNLIAELKNNFPGVKFSVRKSNYSTYEVEWTDGPSAEKVENVTGKFESYSTDETGDFRDYNPSNFNRVFGGFKYVSEYRNYSPKIEALKKSFDSYSIEGRILYRELRRTDIPANFTEVRFEGDELIFEKTTNPVAENVEGVSIAAYSEKAGVVYGDTKPLSETLKRLGCRFNPYLTIEGQRQPGWIFPATRMQEIKNVFSNQ